MSLVGEVQWCLDAVMLLLTVGLRWGTMVFGCCHVAADCGTEVRYNGVWMLSCCCWLWDWGEVQWCLVAVMLLLTVGLRWGTMVFGCCHVAADCGTEVRYNDVWLLSCCCWLWDWGEVQWCLVAVMLLLTVGLRWGTMVFGCCHVAADCGTDVRYNGVWLLSCCCWLWDWGEVQWCLDAVMLLLTVGLRWGTMVFGCCHVAADCGTEVRYNGVWMLSCCCWLWDSGEVQWCLDAVMLLLTVGLRWGTMVFGCCHVAADCGTEVRYNGVWLLSCCCWLWDWGEVQWCLVDVMLLLTVGLRWGTMVFGCCHVAADCGTEVRYNGVWMLSCCCWLWDWGEVQWCLVAVMLLLTVGLRWGTMVFGCCHVAADCGTEVRYNGVWLLSCCCWLWDWGEVQWCLVAVMLLLTVGLRWGTMVFGCCHVAADCGTEVRYNGVWMLSCCCWLWDWGEVQWCLVAVMLLLTVGLRWGTMVFGCCHVAADCGTEVRYNGVWMLSCCCWLWDWGEVQWCLDAVMLLLTVGLRWGTMVSGCCHVAADCGTEVRYNGVWMLSCCCWLWDWGEVQWCLDAVMLLLTVGLRWGTMVSGCCHVAADCGTEVRYNGVWMLSCCCWLWDWGEVQWCLDAVMLLLTVGLRWGTMVSGCCHVAADCGTEEYKM